MKTILSGITDGQSSPESAGKPSPWYVYLVRAANGALYCGITTNPRRRLAQHRSGSGARFFRSSPAQAMVYLEGCPDRPAALRRERAIKQLGKAAKEALITARRCTPDA